MVVNNHYEFQKCTFASLVVKVLDLILSKINIKNGFKVTWIVPKPWMKRLNKEKSIQ
jgi:hypothetical protein